MYTNEEAERSLMEDLSNVPGLKPFIKNRRENVLNQILQTGLAQASNLMIHGFGLAQNYPNPFNPQTTIEYQVPQTSLIDISIYNVHGQKISTLVNKTLPAGSYSIVFNANGLASGIYFYHLKTPQFVKIKKMILLR